MIFIAATDDMEWLKEAFAVKTEDFSAGDIFFSADLFSFVGIEAPGAGEDLALLSLCNHSIISVSCGKYFCIQDFFQIFIHFLGKYIWTVGSTVGWRTGSIIMGSIY